MPKPISDFHDFVGQQIKVSQIVSQLHGARARGEPCPHIRLCGPPGVGKTKLAMAIAKEGGTRLVTILGIWPLEKLKGKLHQLQTGDFLFVDEAHNLDPLVQELLCQVIDHCGYLAEDNTSELEDGFVRIEPCTLILATDRPGKFLHALDSRLPLRVKLSYYDPREMRAIIDQLAKDKQLLITAQARNRLANVSCGLPRRANQQLDKLRLHFPDSSERELTLTDIRNYLSDYGIDEIGLESDERDYLVDLHDVGKASLESMASGSGFDPIYIRRHIEPLLMRHKLMSIGPGGRQLSTKGRQYISKLLNQPSDVKENL